VHAALALRDAGFETIMVNCNPETVSTDYDTRDRLYFEPLTVEDVLDVIEPNGREQPRGGRDRVSSAGRRRSSWPRRSRTPACPSSARSPEAIDLAEDRERVRHVLRQELGLPSRAARHAPSRSRRRASIAVDIGYPVLVRPSYVLGGRAMEIVYDDDDAGTATSTARRRRCSPEQPGARSTASSKTPSRSTSTRVCDGAARSSSAASWSTSRRPRIHSGDSAGLRAAARSPSADREIEADPPGPPRRSRAASGCVGLLNVQFALKDDVQAIRN
jgi:carbamoyl-phosphate synthase large subunit